jgi:hypothetical protein
VGSSEGAASNYKRLFVPLSDAETEQDMRAWYAQDTFDPPLDFTRPLQDDVSQIPAYSALAAQLVETRKRQRHADQFLLGDLPRPRSANGGRPIPREYIMQYRFPPRPGDRTCLNALLCVFNLPSYAPHGYIGREFLLPGQNPTPPDKPARLCFDCLLVEYRSQHARTPNNGTTPVEPINSFTVDPREYGRHCFMETMGGDEHATGIIGLVPIYARNRREIIQIPQPSATAYGLDPSKIHYFVSEVNEDFREASATPTPALPMNSSSLNLFSAASSVI